MKVFKLIFKIFLPILILGLYGCESKKSDTTAILGRIVDAEIKGSTIFLDLNKNGLLDKGEPSTTSDSSGKFTLKVSKELYGRYDAPLVAVGGYDVRLKQDFNQTLMAFRQKGSNSVIITPLSTLIATDVLDNITSNNKNLRLNGNVAISVDDLFNKLQEAQEKFAKLFNLSVDLITKDPIELAKKGNLELLKTNMKVAKVAREIKKAIKKDLKEAQTEAILSYKALSKALKEAQKEAKGGDEVLAEAIDYLQEVVPEAFDNNLIKAVKETTQVVLKSFDEAWEDSQDEIITALKDKQKEFNTLKEEEEKIKTAINSSDTDGDGLPDNLDEFKQNFPGVDNNSSENNNSNGNVDNNNSNGNVDNNNSNGNVDNNSTQNGNNSENNNSNGNVDNNNSNGNVDNNNSNGNVDNNNSNGNGSENNNSNGNIDNNNSNGNENNNSNGNVDNNNSNGNVDNNNSNGNGNVDNNSTQNGNNSENNNSNGNIDNNNSNGNGSSNQDNNNSNENNNSNGNIDNNNSNKLCGIDENLDDSSYSDTPPNNGKNIPYFTVGTKVSDIEAAFNYARSKDSTINKKLILPSQDVWDAMSQEERALYILNKERADRGLKPFEGVEAINRDFSGSNPKTLADIAQGYANTLWSKTTLEHNLDGTVDERLNRVDSLKNREHIPYNENLYAEGNNYKLDDIPLIRAIYNWIYADANPAVGEPWGHRAMCLMKVENDNFGAKGAEGIIAFGIKQGNDYAANPNNYKSSLVVMNAINPPANWNGNYKKATLCKGKNSVDDRFIREDGVIKDTQTNLIWQDINLTAYATKDEGQNICSNLSLNGLSWRLPNANELSKFYKDALSVGVTPNLAQINSNLMVAKDGWVYTTNGAQKYNGNPGDITDAFSSAQKGEIRCVSGKEQKENNQTVANFEIDNNIGVIIDKDTNLMWVNNKEYLTKSSQFKGKIMCNNLELGGYKDWRLPKIDELSNFHKKVYENNVTVNRNFSKCALEMSDKFENNQEYGVVTQAIGSLSNLHVGDEVALGSSVGIRCVREVNSSANVDTIPPELNVTYTQDDLNVSTYEDDKNNHNKLIVRIDLNKEKGGFLTVPVTLKTEPNTDIYELNGSKIGVHIGKSDANGNLILNISNHEEFVAVDENNNISKILEIWVEGVKDISRARAIKFLKQATLGFTNKDIDNLIKYGYEKWLDKYNFRQTRQGYKDAIFSYTKYLYKMMHEIYPQKYPQVITKPTDEVTFPENFTSVNIYKTLKKHVWWAKIFQGFAPVRLKTAYALSNIIVVSADSPAGNLLKWRGEALAYYYDILYKNAFGNYKDLLRDITYSPAMAYYLTYAGSAKFDEAKGTSPDENYARELMQLFTIGINELNLDGTPILDNKGNFIPTYTQKDVVEAAKVFTGWWFVDEGNDGKYGKLKKNNYTYTKPIVFYPEYHDFSAKEILGQTIPKGLSGSEDIEALLNILYSNKNIAPFISKKLIQEFTTSNPSPEYVERVATVFNDNGEGVKGDLKAVVKAILLDPENLSEDHNGNSNFGKTNDLVTVFAQYLKMFNVKGYNYWSFNGNEMYYKTYGRVWIDTKSAFNQSPFDAPDVFNFYQPTFMPSSSDFRNNNLTAPQLQLYTPNNMILFSNTIYNKIESDVYAKLTLFNDNNYTSMDEWMQAKIRGKKKNIGNMFFYLDFTEEYNVMDKAINGGEIKNNFDNLKDKKLIAVKALIDHLDEKLGLSLPSDYKENLAQSIANNSSGGSGKWTAYKIIKNTITILVTSPYFTTIK